MTFMGVLRCVPIEILDNLSKIIKLPGLLFGGINGVKKVEKVFNNIKSSFTGLRPDQNELLEK